MMVAPLSRVFGCFVLAVALWAVFAASALAQSGYKIRAGDQLRIEVLEDNTLNRTVLVLPDGSISFPLVGAVPAGGRTVPDLQQSLSVALAPNFAVTPNVFVAVSGLVEPVGSGVATARTFPTYVMGEVNSPGLLEVERGTTILQLLAQAGGLTRFAAETRIELRRVDSKSGSMTRYLFSYTGEAKGPRISGATQLVEGDVVVVPERRLFE